MKVDKRTELKKTGRQELVTSNLSSNPSAWSEARPEVRLSAGKEVPGGGGLT